MIKIISGAQTGTDLAGIDFARLNGIDWGGFVPLGRKNERGVIPAYYDRLIELPTDSYKCRTYANVEAADFTLIIKDYRVPESPGTKYTLKCLKELGKWDHWLMIGVEIEPFEERSRSLASMLKKYGVVNIAGPRESKAPGIYASALYHLQDMWRYYCET